MSSYLAQALLTLAIAGLATAAWLALLRNRLYGVLLGALAVYGGTTLGSVDALRHEFSATDVGRAGIVFFVGAAALLAGIALTELLLPAAVAGAHTDWREKFRLHAGAHARISMVASVASLVMFVVSRPDLAQTWSEARGEDGFGIVVATTLLLLGFPGIVSAFRARMWFAAFVTLLASAAAFGLSGSRAAALAAIAFLAWQWLSSVRTGTGKLGLVAAVGGFALLLHSALRVVRGVGLVGILAAVQGGNVLDIFRSSPATEDISGGELAIAKYLVFAVQSASSVTYGFMTSIQRLALLLVPHALAPFEKPMDVTNRLWAAGFESGLFDGAEGADLLQESFVAGTYGSLHATLFGEFFLSGGWLSLVLSCLVAATFCVFIDRAVERMPAVPGLLVLGPVLVGMLMCARGNSVIGFGYFVYLSIPSLAAYAVLVTIRGAWRGSAGPPPAPRGATE